MAAMLTEGRKFSLTSVSNKNKVSLMYLKLTDSSLRAIEDFLNSKETNRNASISFSGGIGAIRIPQKKDNKIKTFDFKIELLPNDGSFECIQHQKRPNNLLSLGVMSQKVTIQATDEVYQTTREKMCIAELESKKIHTKEIKSRGPKSGAHVKKILPKADVSRISSIKMLNNNKKPGKDARLSFPGHQAQPKITPASRVSLSSGVNGGQASPSLSTNQKNGSTSSTSSVVTPAMNYNLRDRIVHLLAIKKYSPGELTMKLRQDGIHDKDKESINTILQQVGYQIGKPNEYSLQRPLYATDVRHDWPFFTDDDRDILNKKLKTMSKYPQTVSPCPSNGSQGSPSRSKKRIPASDGAQPPKKVRVAHNAKQDAPRAAASAPSVRNGPPTGHLPASVMDSDMAEIAAVSTFISNEPSDEEFKRMFVPITTLDQRARYKETFNREFQEYQRIHQRVTQRLQPITALQKRIQQETVATPIHEGLVKEIWEEYARLKGDVNYLNNRRQYEYLHRKLQHIKKQVYAFDVSHPDDSE